MPDPWKRRKGESPQAAEASALYCRMGPDRSIDAVVQELNKSRTLLGRWSGRWEWVSRAAEFDEWFAADQLKALTEQVQAQALRWRKRDEEARETKYARFQTWLAKTDKMLEFPLATITTESTEEGGLVVRRTTVKPTRWSMDTVGRLSVQAFELSRQAIRNTDAIHSDDSQLRDQNFDDVPYKGDS